jgi:hypothetical protein
MKRQALPVVERFVQQNPQYTIDADQTGSQGVTNYVIFGQRGDQPVVFKYFCADERKEREVFALRHFAATGLVPRLLEEHGQRLIIISRIPGGPLPDLGQNEHKVDTERIGYTLGQATANLVSVPLHPQVAQDFEDRFYAGQQRLTDYINSILQASWAIHQKVACYSGPLFASSLRDIEVNLPYILGQKRLLYHQDALNMHFADSRFTGFFDLEMCRVGVEAMQIGSLWYVFATYGGWEAFVQGFAAVTGHVLGQQDLNAGRAFAHFLVWRYISRYGDWRGEALTPDETKNEMAEAVKYQKSIELNNRILP